MSGTDTINVTDHTIIVKKYFPLSYIPYLSDTIASSLKNNNIYIAHRPVHKLSHNIFNKIKDKTPLIKKSNVVYQIPCKGNINENCQLSYVDQTRNKLCDRIAQHQYSLKNPLKHTTALIDHYVDHGHFPDFENIKVLEVEGNYKKRCTLESLHILSNNTYNYRRDTNNISNIYNGLINKYKTTQ